MNTRQVMLWALHAAAVIVLVAEYFALRDPARGDTLSEIAAEGTHYRPVLVFAVAFVCGHLFIPRGPVSEAAIAWGKTDVGAWCVFAVGLLLGGLLWSQEPVR